MDILDVALFDDNPCGDKEETTSSSAIPITTTPTGIRWLFTAKDGRVMKKSSYNTNLGALKQAFLDRVLHRRGSSAAERRDSRIAATHGPAGGGIFATALLDSGESVPLDEDAWAVYVVKEGRRHAGAVAVTALAPATSDPVIEPSSRGRSTPQRFTCEYKAVKPDSSSTARGKGGKSTTYVLVSPGLLHGTNANGQQGEDRGTAGGVEEGAATATAVMTTLPDERLVSNVKATNREIEARLGRIVQWVQEVRKVHVLSMAATFTVTPSSKSTAGKPGVWLEQTLHVSMVPTDKKASALTAAAAKVLSLAPIVEPHRIPPTRTQPQPGSKEEHLVKDETAQQRFQQGSSPGAVQTRQHTECGSPTSSSAEDVAVAKPTDDMVPAGMMAPAAFGIGSTAPTSPSPSLPTTATLSDTAYQRGTETQLKSTAQLLSAAADAVLSAGQTSAILTESVLPTVRHKCGGDFCCYRYGGRGGPGSPEHSTRNKENTGGSRCSSNSNSTFDSREGTAAAAAGRAEVDWTDIGMSNGENGAALLEFQNKQKGLPSRENHVPEREEEETLLSLTMKSVGLARAEAKRGQNTYWGEELRGCWREGSRRVASGLRESSPALMYREVRCAWVSDYGIARPGESSTDH